MRTKVQLMTIGFFLALSACQTQNTAENRYDKSEEALKTNRPLVDGKYSLAQDRKEIEDLRSQVPEAKRKQNDELAFVLGLLSEVKKTPSEIRNTFDTAVRKKREVFDKDARKEREDFTKQERTQRDEFLKAQDDVKKQFNATKHSKEDRDRFYQDHEERRKSYFATQREKRDDFESDIRERRKNFDDYIREKNLSFQQELRAYTKKYDEMKKEERAKEKEKSSLNTGDIQSLEDEINAARGMPGQKLESGE